MNFPKYPTALFGFVWGPLRLETCGGGDTYVVNKWPGNFLLFTKFTNVDGRHFAVTHLQKKSRFGFLFMWPFCFHVWLTFRFQKPAVPASERVFYWRVGLARWDALDCRYYSPTWYGPGLHWD